MVQRTVSVGLLANVNNYVAGMAKAEVATKRTAAAAVGSEKALKAQGEAFTKLGTVAAAGGALAAAGLIAVVKATADYGAKMAQLQSLSHANQADMKSLSDAAMSQGAAFGYSATQVADAEIELTKAGLNASQILGGGLTSALSLAAAGQLDVGQATEISTVAMTDFGLKASQLPHVSDLLAAGADKALGSVGDLGEALKNGGQQANNMGLTIDQTVGTLAGFANAGIIGAEAGTQLRSMFIQLQHITPQAKAVLDKYGISIYDTSGKFVGMSALAGELQTKLGGLTQAQRNAALATVFGSHAITGASVLMNLGAKGVQSWTDKVNESGFAAAQAAGKLNSLQGDTQKLGAAFQTDLIKAGTDASGSLRGVVQAATGLLGFLGDLPTPLKDAGVELTVVTAGVGLLGGAALIAVPKILEFKTAMKDAGVSAKSFGGIVGKGSAVLVGLSAIAAGFAAMGQVGTANTQQVEQAGINIKNNWKGVDTVFKSAGSALDSGKGLKASLDEIGDGGAFASAAGPKFIDGATSMLTFGLAGTHLADVYKSNEQTFDAMGQQLAGLAQTDYGHAASSFQQLVTKFHLGADEQRNLLRTMPAYREELIKLLGAAHISATEQNLLNAAQGKGAAGQRILRDATAAAAAASQKQADQLGALSGSAVDATVDISKLQSTIEGFGSAQLDARGATRAMYQAIDDATAAVKKNGRTLDVTTQKGRDNQAALDGIASAADQAASKTLKQTGSAQKAADQMVIGRNAYIRAAEAMGLSASQANKLADKMGLIPGNIRVAVHTTGFDDAISKTKSVLQYLRDLDGKTSTVYINTVASTQAANIARGLQFAPRAAGGAIDGPGPRGVDSVPTMLAPGEHVLTTRDVDALGGQSGVYRLRNALATGSAGYAGGGAINPGYIRGSRGSASPASVNVAAPVVQMPDTITVQDLSGFKATMRVVAHDVVTARNNDIAVHLIGAAS